MDYADKSHFRVSLYGLLLMNLAARRAKREFRKAFVRRQRATPALRCGIRTRLEDGLLYVEPTPAPCVFEV